MWESRGSSAAEFSLAGVVAAVRRVLDPLSPRKSDDNTRSFSNSSMEEELPWRGLCRSHAGWAWDAWGGAGGQLKQTVGRL